MKGYATILSMWVLFVWQAAFSIANPVVNDILKSPNGQLASEVYINDDSHLAMKITRSGKTILHPSPLGIIINSVDLGAKTEIESSSTYSVDEQYPWNGAHSTAENHCNGVVYHLRTDDMSWKLNVRAYNDGVAFRFSCKTTQKALFNGESTTLNFDSSLMSKFMRHGMGEESRVYTFPITKIKSKSRGRTLPPLLMYPSDMSSFIMVLEGGGFDFHGFSLEPLEEDQADTCAFRIDYAEKPDGWEIAGTIDTGWKIICTVNSLNELANTDLVPNVCPAPDQKLFPKGINEEWIKPGTSTWNWWARISWKYKTQLELVDLAAKMGADYHLVDIGWDQKWGDDSKSSYDYLRQLCEHGAKKGVGIFVWKSSDTSLNLDLNPDSGKFMSLKDVAVSADIDKMREEVRRIAEAGAKGIKLDYIQSENSEWKKYMENFLQVTAENKLLVDFHGCPISAGESRTYPNELTREAIYGGEKLRGGGGAEKMPTASYIDLVFTRFIAGAADYTPGIFSQPQGKGFTHSMQLASAVIFTSPLTVWADHPEQYLSSEGIELIRTLPTTWDETIVLPGTELEKLAVFARRKDEDWYVAGINGLADKNQTYTLSPTFLEENLYDTVICKDDMKNSSHLIDVEHTEMDKEKKLQLNMRPSGGFVIHMTRK